MSVLNSHARAVDRLQVELLKGVSAGSTEQFSLLYQQLRTPIVRLVYRYTQRRELVEAIVAETFALVWENPDARRGGTRVLVWIMALAGQRARLTLKSRNDCFSTPQNSETVVEPDKKLSPLRLENMESVVRQMQVGNRVSLELAYHHGFNPTEIATVLDCSESVAQKILWASQEQLYQFLNDSADVSNCVLKSECPQ